MSAFNSANYEAASSNRMLDYLHNQPLDTLTAREELDIKHPKAHVMELCKGGIRINTIGIDRPSDCKTIYLGTCYVLEVGAVAPAPANKADGIHREETDKAENSMGGAI